MARDVRGRCYASCLAGMILIFGSFLAVDGASAQDLQSLIDRLNSLERDLADTQSQVFGPGAKPRSGTISSQPLNSRQSEPRSQDSAFQQVPMLARHQIQLQQLEGQLRDLTGQVEDANYAEETAKLARAQILMQAATAMLSQANQAAQSVLSLLK